MDGGLNTPCPLRKADCDLRLSLCKVVCQWQALLLPASGFMVCVQLLGISRFGKSVHNIGSVP